MVRELIHNMNSLDPDKVRPNVTNLKLQEYMVILNNLVTSKTTRENFEFTRKEIERMVDLGYTMKTAEDLKDNVLDPAKLLSQFEREALVR